MVMGSISSLFALIYCPCPKKNLGLMDHTTPSGLFWTLVTLYLLLPLPGSPARFFSIWSIYWDLAQICSSEHFPARPPSAASSLSSSRSTLLV